MPPLTKTANTLQQPRRRTASSDLSPPPNHGGAPKAALEPYPAEPAARQWAQAGVAALTAGRWDEAASALEQCQQRLAQCDAEWPLAQPLFALARARAGCAAKPERSLHYITVQYNAAKLERSLHILLYITVKSERSSHCIYYCSSPPNANAPHITYMAVHHRYTRTLRT